MSNIEKSKEWALQRARVSNEAKRATRLAGFQSAIASMQAALGSGGLVAISDATVMGADAGLSWGVFGPDGGVLVKQSVKLSGVDKSRAVHVAEQTAARSALSAARGLDRGPVLLLMDCKPAIRALRDSGELGSDRVQWLPREGLGPANDDARAAVGLAPEFGAARGWAGHLETLSASAASGRPKKVVSKHAGAASESKAGRFAKSMSDGAEWTAVVAAVEALPGRGNMGARMAIFDQGAQLAYWEDLLFKAPANCAKDYVREMALAEACERLGRMGAEKACVMLEEMSLADKATGTDYREVLLSRWAKGRARAGLAAVEADLRFSCDPLLGLTEARKAAGRLRKVSDGEALPVEDGFLFWTRLGKEQGEAVPLARKAASRP